MSDGQGPKLVAFAGLKFQPRFDYGEMAQVVEVSGTSMDTELGTGFARMVQADIPWTVRYDEVIMVLEGELSVVTGGETLKAGPKDSLWLPAGTELRYQAQDALVFYAIHPANWAERS